MTFLKKFKSDLASQVNTLLDGLRGRHVKRSRLFNVFPPLEDLERAIAEEVDALAVQGRTTHSLALARAVAGRLDVAPDHTIRGIVPGSIAAWLTWPMDFPTLCWLVPDVIKASLIGTLKAEAFETGPPHADRPAL